MNILELDSTQTSLSDKSACLHLYNWETVARLLLISRALDTLEETQLAPNGEITYQFSAGGHELAQILLGLRLDHPHDGATVYYRSRPFMLALGLTPEEALASTMARAGSISSGRDVGVVYNRLSSGQATVLPMSGNVGAQFTPAAGWAQSIQYRTNDLDHQAWAGAIAAALGGEGAVATNGFWSALTITTTLQLPMLFFIEDNGYAISVKGELQTPGGNIARNLSAFANLTVLNCDGCDPAALATTIDETVTQLRHGRGPILLRVDVPRLPGHSLADNQAYKSATERQREQARDPLAVLREWLIGEGVMHKETWTRLAADVQDEVRHAYQTVRQMPSPNPAQIRRHVFYEGMAQKQGGLLPEDALPLADDNHTTPSDPSAPRLSLIEAIRHTLAAEMRHNPRILLFGEDVGAKGGVHGATRGLQAEFGTSRVFDTSLSEEGIVGRSIGMALAGLLPIPEIQFRKYLEPATEQTHDIGTIRWRTDNQFAAPVILRLPSGFTKKVGDPWHAVSDESILAHKPGWRIAIPSNARDAVGLLRTALRGHDPTIFIEHRALLNDLEARAPYPGDQYLLPFGVAARLTAGSDLTVVTWGAMIYRCLTAAQSFPNRVEVIDLRTLVPWDQETIVRSVKKTARCLVVHEDNGMVGFGAEIIATISREALMFLDAPPARLTSPDCPIPFNIELMNQVIPSIKLIRKTMHDLLTY